MIRGIEEKERHILFICDDNYVMPTAVAIKSVMEHARREREYVIHVCSWKMSDENRRTLSSLTSARAQVCLHILEPEEYQEKMRRVRQKTHVTPTALLKFEIANILPDLPEILYLDSDLIARKSLSELFAYDITDYYLAASFEFWNFLMEVYAFQKDEPAPPFYFNSGVMLLNLRAFRKEKLPEKLWETKFQKFNGDGKKKLMDQDVFNEVCAKKCLLLPIKYNCNCVFTQNLDIRLVNKAFHTRYRDCGELKKDAVVIHYVGKEDKPWVYENVPCFKEWDAYYNKTPYAGRPLLRRKIKRTVGYYAACLLESLKARGFAATVKYIAYKRKYKRG